MWNPNESLPQDFLKLPHIVYAGDSRWHPEGAPLVAFSFSTQNPYFAKNRAWVGVEPGQARLAGFFDPELRIDDQSVAFFGFWESVDALAPNTKLYSEFETWAKAQGAQRVYGPINFTTFGTYRIRLNGFSGGAFPGEPYNPAYYAGILSHLGYSCCQNYLSQMLEMAPTVTKVQDKRDSFRIAPEAKAFSVQPMDGASMLQALPEIYGLVDAIFGENFGYTPIPYELFAFACGAPYAKRLCPLTSLMTRAPDGELAAVFLNFPDYGSLVEQGHPEPVSLSEISFEKDFSRLSKKTLLMKTVGVAPRFRRLGLHNLMLLKMMEEGMKHYSHSVGALIREGNASARFFADICTEVREYGLFVKEL